MVYRELKVLASEGYKVSKWVTAPYSTMKKLERFDFEGAQETVGFFLADFPLHHLYSYFGGPVFWSTTVYMNDGVFDPLNLLLVPTVCTLVDGGKNLYQYASSKVRKEDGAVVNDAREDRVINEKKEPVIDLEISLNKVRDFVYDRDRLFEKELLGYAAKADRSDGESFANSDFPLHE